MFMLRSLYLPVHTVLDVFLSISRCRIVMGTFSILKTHTHTHISNLESRPAGRFKIVSCSKQFCFNPKRDHHVEKRPF